MVIHLHLTKMAFSQTENLASRTNRLFVSHNGFVNAATVQKLKCVKPAFCSNKTEMG